jgi:hypothetical protein
LGNAVVLGPVYQQSWPAFAGAATNIDGLAFASNPDWSIEDDLTRIIGEPPKDQMQLEAGFSPRKQEYPPGWPFGEPFLR